jgi:hypothetical protein
VAMRVGGSSILLRGQGGVQYDPTSHWRLGGAVRTPGATLIKSATLTFDGVLAAGNASLGASLFDPSGQPAYHLPWEFRGGAAFVHERAQFEVTWREPGDLDARWSAQSRERDIRRQRTRPPPSIVTQPFRRGLLRTASSTSVLVAGGAHPGRSLRFRRRVKQPVTRQRC